MKKACKNLGLRDPPSSVDSSASIILRSWVPTQSALLRSIIVLTNFCHCIEKRTKISKKEAGFGLYEWRIENVYQHTGAIPDKN